MSIPRKLKMLTKVISYANQKGGVGKSTMCLQNAFYLAEKKCRVLVIDMDPQGNTSSRLFPGEVPNSATLAVELFEDNIEKVEVLHCESGVDLIYTPKNDLVLSEIESASLNIAKNPKKHLKGLIESYDYVLIDCPPSLGRKLVAALLISTHVVCPVKLSGFAVDGVEGILKTIVDVQQSLNRKLKILGIIINDMNRSKNHDRTYKKLKDAVPDLILKNKIMHRPPLDQATTEGVPVWSLRHGHVAAKEVKAVLNEIMKKLA